MANVFANKGLDIYDENTQKHIAEYAETRVALVIDDLTNPKFNPNTCTDSDFLDKAEEQGTVFTLKRFEQYIYSGELNELTAHVPSTQYLFPRFIRMYRTCGENQRIVTADELGVSEE